jgi:cardiolipin synthase
MHEEWYEIVTWGLAAHLALILGALVTLILLSSMLRQQRSPAASAAWLVFMLAVPYLGVPLYLLIGTRKLKSLAAQKQRLLSSPSPVSAGETCLQNLLSRLGAPAPREARSFTLHRDADQARRSLASLLEKARETLDIEIFILGDDDIGRELIDRLIGCVARGVRVRLVLDGVGSFLLPKRRLRPLVSVGAQVAWFVPVLHIPLRGRSNLRNHRKLIVADGDWVWSGGRNLAVDYLGPEDQTRWRDLSFDLTGPAARDFQAVFNADWGFAAVSAIEPVELPDRVEAGQQVAHLAQVIPSGPDTVEDVLEQVIAQLIAEARERIALVTPYFVPSETLQTLLCIAARRGTQLDILMPARSNHHMADYVRNRFLRRLQAAGASIHLLGNEMLHAKALIVDERYALVGSANFDLRSLYLNFELTVLLYSPQDVSAISGWVDALLSRTEPWTEKPHGAIRETLEGLVMVTAFQF